ncbi:thiolase C-terminal domain-containing protein [Natronobeatus ordinarius]|uniref:thiolase C-terminal domain-containing protein n=1 Tax=Natronobeatus ordinarius TaxID=2963433 RepID=UPI0020CE878E|nr:beta-ketoacyl synthase N-terminal-like domain-containing protein [Natronobeatus ordinarius]
MADSQPTDGRQTRRRETSLEGVRVAAIGQTSFGSSPNRTARDLFADAADEAFRNSALEPRDVEEVFYGNFMGELSESQGHQAPLAADVAGVSAPATRLENACASGGTAVRYGLERIRSGSADVVLVGGAERMTHMSTDDVTAGLSTAADALYEITAGVTFPGAYALMAQAYFAERGGSRTDLAHIAVKNHENALENDHAHIQQRITVEEALEAPPIAEPLGLYDCCPISDGASVAVLTSDAYARQHGLDAPIAITGSGQAGDRLALQDRPSLSRTPATEKAATRAYSEAAVTPADVDCAEVHDCFTIAEAMAIEALGFADPGEGVSAARAGLTTADGDVPVNLSGGLKAKGHPVGATGVSQLTELTRLLRGDHPNSDALSNPRVGVAHNAGGTVASTTVHVLEVVA